MSDPLDPIEEQSLDALLSEIHGQNAPDLTEQILTRFRKTPINLADPSRSLRASSVDDQRPAKPTEHKRIQRRAAAVLAAIAASLLIVWLIREPRQNGGIAILPSSSQSGSLVTKRDQQQSDGQVADEQGNRVVAFDDRINQNRSDELSDDPNADRSMQEPAIKLRPKSGVPLVMDERKSLNGNSSSADSLLAEARLSDRQPTDLAKPAAMVSLETSKPLLLVSQQIDSNMHDYWSSVGIEPSHNAVDYEVAERLSKSLGVEVPTFAIESVQAFDSFLADDSNAKAIAKQFLSSVTERGIERLDTQAQQALVNELSACFTSSSSLDDCLARWISGQDPNSVHWYAANAAGGSHALARRLALLSMNVDLRCIQCHDSLIESRGSQNEYWSFHGLLQRSLVREKGRIQRIVSQVDSNHDAVFYEASDGRQRVAIPSVPANWLSSTTDSRSMDLQQWSQSLVGSRELARGVVNALWRMVYGRPLRGSVVDPMTAPHTESLGVLEKRLVDDLLSSRFDLGRSFSLVVTAPAIWRSVPPQLLQEHLATASEEETVRARNMVDAFAAALPRHATLPLARKVDFASRSIGVSLDVLNERAELLAQTADLAPTKSSLKPSATPVEIEQFPLDADAPPVHWLSLVQGVDEQIKHLGYLVPLETIPESVTQVASRMQTANIPPSLILQRVWWIIHR